MSLSYLFIDCQHGFQKIGNNTEESDETDCLILIHSYRIHFIAFGQWFMDPILLSLIRITVQYMSLIPLQRRIPLQDQFYMVDQHRHWHLYILIFTHFPVAIINITNWS